MFKLTRFGSEDVDTLQEEVKSSFVNIISDEEGEIVKHNSVYSVNSSPIKTLIPLSQPTLDDSYKILLKALMKDFRIKTMNLRDNMEFQLN